MIVNNNKPKVVHFVYTLTRYHVTCILTHPIFIGYWIDMEIYVRVLVRSNIARRQERNINYEPERVHIFPYPTNNLFITYALLSQKAL